MTTEIFQTWFFDVFMPFVDQYIDADEPVLLLMDNFSAHKLDSTIYGRITISLLPANCTTHLQQLDAGVIKTLKDEYYLAHLKAVLDAQPTLQIDYILADALTQPDVHVLHRASPVPEETDHNEETHDGQDADDLADDLADDAASPVPLIPHRKKRAKSSKGLSFT
jgi:hypothetical protein